MRKTIYWIVLLIFSLNTIAQSGGDSLLAKINGYVKEDTVLVEMIIDYCVNKTFEVNEDMLKLSKQSLRISQKLNYKKGEIRSLNNIGNYYYQLSIYDKAVDYYNKALNKSIEANDVNNIIISKSNLASLYTRNKETNKALKLFVECDSILVNRGDSIIQNRAALLVNLGNAYSAMGKHVEAILYYQKANAICNKLNIAFGKILSLSNIASEYVFMKNYNEAINFLKKAEEIANENKADFFLTQIHLNFGLSYSALGQNDKAIEYLTKSITLCKATGDNQTLLSVYKNLHPVYLKLGKKEEAYNILMSFTVLNDSLLGAEKQKTINELNIKYDAERKDFEIKELEQTNRITKLEAQQKNQIIYSILIVCLFALLLAYFLFMRYKTKKQNELLQLKLKDAEVLLIEKQKAAESEIKAIKSQMNPHFFYNALNSIQGFIYNGDKDKASEAIGIFSELSRAILEHSRQKEICLSDEIDLLNSYLKLECMRLPKIHYKINVAKELNIHDVYLPPMILQPIAENAIKHGLANKDGQGLLQIHFSKSNNYIEIVIDDNGIGREASAKLNRLSSVRRTSFSTEANINRIDLLNESLEQKILFEIIDKLSNEGIVLGTTVKISIPIIE